MPKDLNGKENFLLEISYLLEKDYSGSDVTMFKETLDSCLKEVATNGVNFQDENGDSALHLACLGKTNPKIMELLLQNGADPNLKNNQGNTPLHNLVLAGEQKYVFDKFKKSTSANFSSLLEVKNDSEYSPIGLAIGLPTLKPHENPALQNARIINFSSLRKMFLQENPKETENSLNQFDEYLNIIRKHNVTEKEEKTKKISEFLKHKKLTFSTPLSPSSTESSSPFSPGPETPDSKDKSPDDHPSF